MEPIWGHDLGSGGVERRVVEWCALVHKAGEEGSVMVEWECNDDFGTREFRERASKDLINQLALSHNLFSVQKDRLKHSHSHDDRVAEIEVEICGKHVKLRDSSVRFHDQQRVDLTVMCHKYARNIRWEQLNHQPKFFWPDSLCGTVSSLLVSSIYIEGIKVYWFFIDLRISLGFLKLCETMFLYSHLTLKTIGEVIGLSAFEVDKSYIYLDGLIAASLRLSYLLYARQEQRQDDEEGGFDPAGRTVPGQAKGVVSGLVVQRKSGIPKLLETYFGETGSKYVKVKEMLSEAS
ncbi:hypothetical protein Scep_009747 [Stephania cephalantha]|uniref:Uncharacterized protein n=1 Tax=Stephania cephalantha TaxID=152367 RepID=A0AAP0PGJ8_9MAGN